MEETRALSREVGEIGGKRPGKTTDKEEDRARRREVSDTAWGRPETSHPGPPGRQTDRGGFEVPSNDQGGPAKARIPANNRQTRGRHRALGR